MQRLIELNRCNHIKNDIHFIHDYTSIKVADDVSNAVIRDHCLHLRQKLRIFCPNVVEKLNSRNKYFDVSLTLIFISPYLRTSFSIGLLDLHFYSILLTWKFCAPQNIWAKSQRALFQGNLNNDLIRFKTWMHQNRFDTNHFRQWWELRHLYKTRRGFRSQSFFKRELFHCLLQTLQNYWASIVIV